MRRNSMVALLLLAFMLSIGFAPQAFSKETSPLAGTWDITHRPVDAAGKPCPYLPDSITFFNDSSLVMSNFPGMHMAFKTKLTAAETEAFDRKAPEYHGKSLLLVKLNPKMEWTATPMVYVYSVVKDEMQLTARGWDAATFKRVKK